MKFIKVAKQNEVAEGCMKGVEVDGKEILLACVKGKVYAFDAICNHGYAYMEEGELDGYDIVCPLHAGSFDIRSGAITCPPVVEPMTVFPVRIEDDHILIDIDGNAGA